MWALQRKWVLMSGLRRCARESHKQELSPQDFFEKQKECKELKSKEKMDVVWTRIAKGLTDVFNLIESVLAILDKLNVEFSSKVRRIVRSIMQCYRDCAVSLAGKKESHIKDMLSYFSETPPRQKCLWAIEISSLTVPLPVDSLC